MVFFCHELYLSFPTLIQVVRILTLTYVINHSSHIIGPVATDRWSTVDEDSIIINNIFFIYGGRVAESQDGKQSRHSWIAVIPVESQAYCQTWLKFFLDWTSSVMKGTLLYLYATIG